MNDIFTWEVLTNWLLIASVNLAATMSPGPAFALTVRNSLAYDRRTGILTAVGLGFGVGIYVALVLGGVSVLITQSEVLYNIVRYAGAAYLFYIGIKAILFAKPRTEESFIDADGKIAEKSLPRLAAIRNGFLVNAFNPKAVVFFTAVYAQFVDPHTPWQALVLFGATAIFIEMAWFSALAFILTDSRIKRRFLRFTHWIERVCGGLLILLGIRLALK
jgi:RhtB (resistance to homoserine/threonine) family protein